VQKLNRDQIAAMIRDLGDMVSVLAHAEPARKAKIYATLGLRLTYQPAGNQVLVSQASSQRNIGERFVSEGRVAAYAHACPSLAPELVLGATVTWRAGRWPRWTTTGCVPLLSLIAATVSYLHTQVELHGQPR